MLGLRYYKADPATYLIQTRGGKVRRQGRGLSFFFYAPKSSLTAVPVSAQEAPFIFTLQTADYQALRVQGQITFRAEDPLTLSQVLNFTLADDGKTYVSEDPLKLADRVVRVAQTLVQKIIQATPLRDALKQLDPLDTALKAGLNGNVQLQQLGLSVLEASVLSILPTPETAKALEAEARESILKESDDAIYDRRRSALEQERSIKEAELQTDIAVQRKQQEIAAEKLENERALAQRRAVNDRERLEADIAAEAKREELISQVVTNREKEANADAHAITVKLKAYEAIPVDKLKAMAMAQMAPDQLMALAMDSFATNADKIGNLNITPDLLQQLTAGAR